MRVLSIDKGTATARAPQEFQDARAQANQTTIAQNAMNATALAPDDRTARTQARATPTATAQESWTEKIPSRFLVRRFLRPLPVVLFGGAKPSPSKQPVTDVSEVDYPPQP